MSHVETRLHSRGPGRMVPDKERIVALLDLLGNPQRAYPSIHITGTNGKTSTARMIDALLRAHEVRPGRYTSPHLTSVAERICLDGAPISDERFVETFTEVDVIAQLVDAQSANPVTYFELLTAMAFSAFADAPVDVAVVEVGMGGEWDATNVIDAPVAVITPIGLDHAEFLGDNITDIAKEKSGIIAEGATVISAIQEPAAAEILIARTVAQDATVAREGMEFGVLNRELAVGGQVVTLQGLGAVYDDIFLPLHGAHQAQNAALALAAVEAFLGVGAGKILDAQVVRQGFALASSPGRLERLRTSPTVLVDAAHNPAGLTVTLQAIEEAFSFRKLVAVFAVLGDKDARSMLEQLEAMVDEIVITQNSSPRALNVDELAAMAVDVFGPDRVEVCVRFDDAIDAAVRLTEDEGPLAGAGVLVTGSVATVADARRLLQ